MGFFDKKYCDICGEKIGMLGNRKLEDGNMCKNCAKKLSPFFDDRRHSTIKEIKEQLAYREENERQLNDFHPTMTFGDGTKVMVDMNAQKFIITDDTDWREANPDIIDIGRVVYCDGEVKEDRNEMYFTDDNNERRSFVPPRYEYKYSFIVDIEVDSPWFKEIKIDLTGYRKPDSVNTLDYQKLQTEMNNLVAVLNHQQMPNMMQGGFQQQGMMGTMQGGFQQQGMMGTMQGGFPQQGMMGTMQGGFPQQGMMNGMQGGFPQQGMINGMQGGYPQQGGYQGQPINQGGFAQEQNQAQNGSWTCQKCGSVNSSGSFCQSCGSKR
ncbi:DUF4428 domain-containing protein [Criibacterium bergeronii]|uniref:DUF4428 domain-containing protein n=1 Tax=Criibacterium bergeronii TaxID=1871336 RepID=A0A552V0S1_9FIRM|nr:DUF4428 domain-containing protein [Criibacterium bergeronii]TRW24066.1 DUF4428 domain-containing protein [Criibacterium bergeronii]